MFLNIIVHNFEKNGKIKEKYICKKHGGNDVCPKVSWNNIENAKSYALVMEDPDAVGGNLVHWYIPFISPNPNINIIEFKNCKLLQKLYEKLAKKNNFENSLNKLNLIIGKNTLGNFGYHGPCPPKGSGVHRYIFNLYALDGKLNINSDNIQISGTDEFKTILKDQGIKVIDENKVQFLKNNNT
jgi:Raf kinase inhibitor-like YbhB/YbcL family protein